jgi:hypothetical protein
MQIARLPLIVLRYSVPESSASLLRISVKTDLMCVAPLVLIGSVVLLASLAVLVVNIQNSDPRVNEVMS